MSASGVSPHPPLQARVPERVRSLPEWVQAVGGIALLHVYLQTELKYGSGLNQVSFSSVVGWWPGLLLGISGGLYAGRIFKRSEFWRRYMFWTAARVARSRVLWGTAFAMVLLTELFVLVGSILIGYGWIDRPVGIGSGSISWALWERFGWHLLAGIPVLDIPETLHWTPRPEIIGNKMDGLFLSYKIVVLLPVLSAIAECCKRPDAATPEPG